MHYRLLADFVVILHFAYVAFVVFGLLATILGGILKWKWVHNRWFRGIHLTMILIVVIEAWAGITCPLTTWEHEFRSAAGQQSYEGDFIANWFHDAMFFTAPPWMFTLGYTLFGGIVLASVYWVPPRWKKIGN
ncbi:MAG: DUF2784 domain-containing protein [Rubripirellula sp.]